MKLSGGRQDAKQREQSAERRARRAYYQAALDRLAPGVRLDDLEDDDAGAGDLPPAPAPYAPPTPRKRRKPKQRTQAQRRDAEKERRRRVVERNERRDREQAKRLEQRATDEGWTATTSIELQLGSETKQVNASLRPLRVVALWIQLAMWSVLLDTTGRAARYRLRRMRNKVLAGWTRRIAYAAADRRAERGLPRGNVWADLRARRVVAVGFFFDAMGEHHRKRGRWLQHVDGVPVDFLRWLLRDPTQHYERGCFAPVRRDGNARAYRSARGVPSQSSVTGVSRTRGRWFDGTCGVVEAFRQTGAMFTRSNVALSQKYATRSGYQPNDYLILSDVVEHHDDSAQLAQLVEWEHACERSGRDEPARAPPVTS